MTSNHPTVSRALGVLAAVLSLAATPALAHTGGGATGGLAAGLTHPLLGLDHVLAMVTVGLFASQLGGRALWGVPAAFVVVMALGGAWGVAGLGLPFVETGIALSVIVLGAAVALRIRAPLALAAGLAGVFAVFHGHAHGGEMPLGAGGVEYGLGFMIATAGLHATGIGAGLAASRLAAANGALAVRVAGVAVAAAGLAILGGIA